LVWWKKGVMTSKILFLVILIIWVFTAISGSSITNKQGLKNAFDGFF